jgi:ankyrin repeat protein
MSAKILIDNGADVNAYSNLGKTPLHFAAMNNHVNLLKLLVASHADIKIRDDAHCVPLHLACKKGSIDAVKFLLFGG